MARRPSIFATAGLLVAQACWAQVRYPTLDDSRRAIRCSLIYAIAAREAPDLKIRDANLFARKLVLELGSMSAGTQLALSWVDELEKEVPSLHGEALMALNDDCRHLMREYRDTLAFLLERQRK
jgi:hypothetical protein